MLIAWLLEVIFSSFFANPKFWFFNTDLLYLLIPSSSSLKCWFFVWFYFFPSSYFLLHSFFSQILKFVLILFPRIQVIIFFISCVCHWMLPFIFLGIYFHLDNSFALTFKISVGHVFSRNDKPQLAQALAYVFFGKLWKRNSECYEM